MDLDRPAAAAQPAATRGELVGEVQGRALLRRMREAGQLDLGQEREHLLGRARALLHVEGRGQLHAPKRGGAARLALALAQRRVEAVVGVDVAGLGAHAREHGLRVELLETEEAAPVGEQPRATVEQRRALDARARSREIDLVERETLRRASRLCTLSSAQLETRTIGSVLQALLELLILEHPCRVQFRSQHR